MSETLPRPELEEAQAPLRLEYGAVPLDPYHAVDFEGGGDYIPAANTRIRDKLQVAVINAVESGLVREDKAKRIFDLMEVALYNSQMSRIERNPSEALTLIPGAEDDERIIRAKSGVATPLELLTILEDYPELGSIELAKLSHPFDFPATQAMDADVLGAILDRGGGLATDPPRYKRKGVDNEERDAPMGIVLRKKTFVSHRTKTGDTIEVVERRGFVTWCDETMHADADLARKIRNPERFPELAEKIEGYLAYIGQIPEPNWLQPLATSYYARVVPAPKATAKAAR